MYVRLILSALILAPRAGVLAQEEDLTPATIYLTANPVTITVFPEQCSAVNTGNLEAEDAPSPPPNDGAE